MSKSFQCISYLYQSRCLWELSHMNLLIISYSFYFAQKLVAILLLYSVFLIKHSNLLLITHFSVLFQDESLRLTNSHFFQLFPHCAGHTPYLFSTYIPCAILELSDTIPELADTVRIPTLRRTIPELYRFLLCAEHIYSFTMYNGLTVY